MYRKIIQIGALASLVLMLYSCSESKRDAIGKTEVCIETSEGDIIVRLYDDTPLHRDNFIRNVEAHAYDNIPFHRIVPEMVIQAGGNTKETIAAELRYPLHFHKQGALAAAREPDSVNAGRASNALQWFIVTGKKYSAAELAELQVLLYDGKVSARFERLQREHSAQLQKLKESDYEAYQSLLNSLQTEAENAIAANPPKPFNAAQKQVYANSGGAPHLDGEYTVFGEVVEGMPIAMRIGRTPVDAKERPRRNVRIIRTYIK
ncbi:MAG: peptidylprolyl isomerase [Bacteroidaceae bacterium]|nr:peptidylprolyl isomerase [Bacteroidaceae bacterium]